MNIEVTENFFMWCVVLNYAILILWCLVYKLGHDWHYGITKRWFTVSEEEYDNLNLKGVAIYKVAILMLNLVPYIALRIIS